MVRQDKAAWKAKYFTKLISFLNEYSKILIVGADNVGSSQMQQIRIKLRGTGEVLMGKNTMIRKAIKGHLVENPALEKLLPLIKGNMGFVFTKDDLSSTRDICLANKVKAPAKAGALAPIDVFIPAQVTTMGPEKTSFFQALSITTKITRGTIEILNDVHIVKKGDKVGASESTLLSMMGIYPFSYGLEVLSVYDNGSVYSPDVLNIKPSDLLTRFLEGVSNVASLSLAINYPTVASVPHSIANGFKNVLAIALATDITFRQAENAKEMIKNPSKFVVAAAPVAAVAAKVEEKKPAAPKKKTTSEDADMGFGLFD
jgi:large subunit ribosomal protein LP0